MRYIRLKENREELINNLDELIKNHKSARVRNRATALKLNIKNRVTIPKLSEYFNVKKRAIYDWFNRFENLGIMGVIEKKGRGRKKKIKDKKKLKI